MQLLHGAARCCIFRLPMPPLFGLSFVAAAAVAIAKCVHFLTPTATKKRICFIVVQTKVRRKRGR